MTIDNGEDISKIRIRHKEIFQTGEILSSEEYIKNLFRETVCFVFRRNKDNDLVKLYGGYYADAFITDYHLQFGNIVCLNEAGYVYVHYKKSIWSQQLKNKDHIVFAHAIYLSILIPRWKSIFYSTPRHLSLILEIVRLAQSGYRLTDNNLNWIQRFDSFLYHSFNRDLSSLDRIHLSILAFYIRVLRKINPKFSLPYKLLSLMT